MKLFSVGVHMTGVNLFDLVVAFFLFWQGEQGDLGEAGYPGVSGLPGPQVTKRTSELFLC